MARLSRAQTQERNRARVLAAARAEFAERGFREAKIDAIAERAELTRGAVYSNFPGKRALYFAVLAESADPATPGTPGRTLPEALGAFARSWVAGLPDAAADGAGRLGVELIPEVQADAELRRCYDQLLRLSALLLADAAERLHLGEPTPGRPGPRLTRLAATVLTTLHGADALAAAAPGFAEPFDVISACEQLAGLELNDWWAPPSARPPIRPADEPWRPEPVLDLVHGAPTAIGDGVVGILGLHRAAAAQDLVRATGTAVTVALVTGQPAELVPLTRLVLGRTVSGLRQAFPADALPRLRIVCDESGEFAAAAGLPSVSDATEAAIAVRGGRIVARADGFDAAFAVASGTLVA